jgi:flagellar basal body-associated protein FliL
LSVLLLLFIVLSVLLLLFIVFFVFLLLFIVLSIFFFCSLQTIQWTNEKDKQYNEQKKKDKQYIELKKKTDNEQKKKTDNTMNILLLFIVFFVLLLLFIVLFVLLLLFIVLSIFFFCSLYCLSSSFVHCIQYNEQKKKRDNTMNKRRRTNNAMNKRRRTNNTMNKWKRQTIQWTKEEGQTIYWTKEEDRQWTKVFIVLSVFFFCSLYCLSSSFVHCIVCPSSMYGFRLSLTYLWSGTYPWSFMTQIFHNGQPSHGGDVQLLKLWLHFNQEKPLVQ